VALEVRVHRPGREDALAHQEALLDPDRPLEGEIQLPPLEDGPHRVTVRLGDHPDDPDATLHSDFMHRTFGWEHNDLGLEPEVIPPFEPLMREGRDVHAVLRRYRVGPSGLIDEIDSLETALLAAPLRFEVTLGGKRPGERPVEPDGAPRFEQPSPGRIEYSSRWRAGSLRATAHARMDVDGFLWIDLDLPEQPAVVVDGLDLVIPVRADIARLMNVVTDRTRHNEAGAVPEGEGVVWRSAEARRVELRGSFVPYIWLGDGARGLAFVAASDRDWAPPVEASAQVLEREGDRVTLRVRLIGRATRLERSRRLSFGLQATPTKPSPFRPTWRLWQPSCRRTMPALSLCILATSWEWGGATTYGSFEPAAGNEGILDALAATRATGRVPDGEVERWLARRTAPSPRPEAVRRSLAKSFANLASRPAGVVAYVNSHKVGPLPELEVYRDEWSPAPFSGVRRSALRPEELMATFPSRSWQDFALWHLDALLESGAIDGFFIDNTFLSAVFDETSGAAYRDETGLLRPSTDLLELRSFMRRLQTLAYQKRGRWLNVSHMTNALVAPVQTWSAATLDGELRYGPEPFGERFSRDWLRAESIGDQVGALPLFLPGVVGVRDGDDRDRVQASVVAGTAVHEIRVFGGASAQSRQIWGPLHRFGYGKLDARVYRYWDPSPPFRLAGVDGEALVVARDGEAMALVAALGEGGVARLVVDGPALGLEDVTACRDATTGRRLRPSKGFRCDFLIPDHGYRLILFGKE
jgi:hypothetical protein